MAFVLDGFANAVEVISGRAIGRGNKYELQQGLILSGIWTFSLACLFSLGYLFFGSELITLLTTIPDVITIANDHLIWLVIMPIIATWSFLFDGLFIGTTRSVEMRNSMLSATFICYLPAWYFLQTYGNHGLWFSFLIFFAARGLGQAFYLPRLLSFK
jgi:MATE family multidrug resistance protein